MKLSSLNLNSTYVAMVGGVLLFVASYATAFAGYTYELSPTQTFPNVNTTNSLGDAVGYINDNTGTRDSIMSYASLYDGSFLNIIYPSSGHMWTTVFTVNDQRLVLGEDTAIGQVITPFVYDLVDKKFTVLDAIQAPWVSVADLNNKGQVTGVVISNDGATRKGFVYDCQNGQVTIDVPGSNWTLPSKIDDQGNVYGSYSGFSGAYTYSGYFVARPDVPTNSIGCMLVTRSVASPVTYVDGPSFKMVGDVVVDSKIGDFDGLGKNDIIVDHGNGVVTIYYGETSFSTKTKFSGQTIATVLNKSKYRKVVVVTNGDINGDGLSDLFTTSGRTALVQYQQLVIAPAPVVTPSPVITPTPVVTNSTEQPYRDALELRFPGSTVTTLKVQDTGEADYKLNYNGNTYEGIVSRTRTGSNYDGTAIYSYSVQIL